MEIRWKSKSQNEAKIFLILIEFNFRLRLLMYSTRLEVDKCNISKIIPNFSYIAVISAVTAK